MFPFAIGVPPLGVEYQLTIPFEALALRVKLDGPQLLKFVTPFIDGIVIVVLVEICKIGSPVMPPYSTTYPFGW